MRESIERILLVLLFATLFGCSKNENSNIVKITIQVPSEKLAEVKISVINMLNLEISSIAEAKLDALGRCILKFPLDKPMFASLKIGLSEHDIYIDRGYELNMSIKDDANKTTFYSGTGSEVNNYLTEIFVLRRRIEETDGKNIFTLDTERYLNRLDTLEKSLTQFHEHFIDSVRIPNYLISLLDSRNKLRVLLIKQALQWNYGVAHNFEIPKTLDITSEIPYDYALLNNGISEYAFMLHFSMNIKRSMLQRGSGTYEEKTEREKEMPLIIRNEIQTGNYSSDIKEFLLAKNTDYWMALLGIATPMDKLYSDFKSQYNSSRYLNSLESRYLRFLSISPGHQAPAITGKTLVGDSISLSNFKGKVVYVDVWASWCGPCVAEIPAAEKLQAVFRGNDSVIFLNVSVDQNISDWKGALSKYKDWKGVQILNDRSIYKTYNITGIPRYILIDTNGNILNVDAPRPSSKELESEIRKLLR